MTFGFEQAALIGQGVSEEMFSRTLLTTTTMTTTDSRACLIRYKSSGELINA